MRRWAKNILCLLSLLIFVGSVAIGVRSGFAVDQVRHYSNISKQTDMGPTMTNSQIGVQFVRGSVGLFWIRNEYHGSEGYDDGWYYQNQDFALTRQRALSDVTHLHLHLLGLHLQYVDGGDGYERYQDRNLILPLWLFLPFGIPPLLWLRNRRRASRRGFAVEVGASSPAAPEKIR